MGKRIEFDDAARKALWRGVDQLAGAVRVTLGPRGRNIILDRGAAGPAITNDGLTIAREIELADPFENMGAELLREAASRTGEAAGDGTTTATVLAHRIVGEGLRAAAAGCHPVALKRGIEAAVRAAVASIASQAVQVRGRADLARIATVSSSDAAIGDLVADALDRVGRAGMVTVENGHGLHHHLEFVEGMRFDRGYLSPYFITDPENMLAEHEDVHVLLAEFKLTAARELLPALELAAQSGRPLLIVAEEVEGEALATLVVNRLRGTLHSIAVKAPAAGEERRAQLEDLAVVTGARLLTADRGDRMISLDPDVFGRAKRVVVDSATTTVVEGGGAQDRIRGRMAQIEGEVAACDASYDRERLRRRLARLGGGIGVIQVGAPTESEMRERRSRIEDALAATRAAFEEGVVPGAGVALVRALVDVQALVLEGDEAVGRDIVARALEEPARQIVTNAGEESDLVLSLIRGGEGAFGFDAATGRYGDLVEAGIVDAAKVVRCALQNAASIGTMLLTTDAVVVDVDDEEDGPPE